MRRWGRALRNVGDGNADFADPAGHVGIIDLTDDMPPALVTATSPNIVEEKNGEFPPRAMKLDTTPGRDFVRPIPIHPDVSKAFHAKLRAGLKESAASVPALHRARHSIESSTSARSSSSNQPTGPVTLVWLRPFDLRLHDHPAFNYAANRGCPVQVVFVWSDAEDAALGEWQLAGTAAAFWLHHAIQSLDASLRQKHGLSIAIRTGETVATALLAAVQESGADEVVTSTAFEPTGPAGYTAQEATERALEGVGIKLLSFNSFLLQDIKNVRVDMGTYRGHFGTLTPFHHACMTQPPVQKPLRQPSGLVPVAVAIADESLEALGFARMPVRKDGSVLDWGAQILAEWDISEEAALCRLRHFLADGLGRYEKGRQLADASAVTKISPYLRFGMLSSRLMFHEMKAAGAKEKSIVYWRRLVWRDLAYWQLSLFPKMRTEPIRAHYAGQVWNIDQNALRRWQRGVTGYPIVDAGMRELWSTGWMAQNVRMLAAILLCEHLNIHWIEGERWFHHTLVDADSAINAMMWQNAGKSGLDQWNFTMSAATSGKNMDPKGDYVRRWCPELAKLPGRFVHTPWDAPEHVLREAGVSLGSGGTYPERIVVDLKTAARRSGDAIRNQRKRALEWSNDQGYDLIVLPNGSTVAHDGQKFRVFTVPQYRNISEGASGAAFEERASLAKGRRKGEGKGKRTAKGFRENEGSLQSSATDSERPVKASYQSVLHEYMKASGG